MTINELALYCNKKIMEYPSLEKDIKTYYLLALNQVHKNETETKHCDLAHKFIEGLIQDLL